MNGNAYRITQEDVLGIDEDELQSDGSAVGCCVQKNRRPLLESIGKWFNSTIWRKGDTDVVPLGEKTLLAFSGAKGNVHEVTFEDGTRNVLVLGATGSGKTISVMRPALRRLVEQNCSGLVLDVKGDYYNLLKEVCPDRLHIVGPGCDATPTNLLASMTDEMVEAFLLDLVKESSGDQEGGGYWGSMAVQDCLLVAKFIRNSEGRSPSLADFYDALLDPLRFCMRLDAWLDKWIPGEALKLAIKQSAANAFGMLNKGRSKYATEARPSSTELAQQWTWHVSKLLPALSRFGKSTSVRENLCAGSAMDFVDILYRQKKIILFDMPVDIFGPAAFTSGRLLRINVMAAILGNAWFHRGAKGGGLGNDHFTFLLMDEYQQFVSAEYGSVASGVPDDNTWFDRSRSFGHINIVATQGISSLLAQTNADVVSSIVQNFRTLICLPTADPNTLELVNKIGGSSAVERVLHPRNYGDGFLYCSSAKKSDTGQGGTIESVIEKWGGTSKHLFMQPDKNVSEGSRERFVFDEESDNAGLLMRQLSENSPRRFDVNWNGIHVVTTRLSKGYEDFLVGLSDRGSEYVANGRLAELPRVVGRYDVNDESPFGISHDKAEWCTAVNKAYARARPGDIIALVRGGGDRQSEGLMLFDSDELITTVKSCKDRVVVATGIAHTGDRFRIEGAVEIPAAFPGQAGHEVVKYIVSQPDLAVGCELGEIVAMSDEDAAFFENLLGPAEPSIGGGIIFDPERDTEIRLRKISELLGEHPDAAVDTAKSTIALVRRPMELRSRPSNEALDGAISIQGNSEAMREVMSRLDALIAGDSSVRE